ncbi:putative equisetin synthetase [Hypoxylon sp. FL1857]|nr:putative equisetin synthetase [Hypoxylon sp. FL1857]
MAPSHQEPIAVIGSACRFPGSSDTPSKLWELLQSPRDLLKRVPADRFDASAYYHPDSSHHGTTDCQESYFLDEDLSQFDSGFFNIQPAEVEAIDPQQRLLMETVYDSLCAAGQTIEGLRGSSTGVYVGVMCDDWSQISNRDWDLIHIYAATGTSRCIISNRISYFFDWHGPSMTIDTACSSSLVCVHQAVQALRNGESRVAIAAGANLILSPGMYIAESKLNMLSPTGRSRMWDADADGYARGEGLASVVLKPLSAAIEDGDHIECIIRGTGVNQDGRTAGLTMPSNIAQADLIRSTYARAGLDLNDPKDRPQFFHAHGTGTPAGDPQESEAISRAFFGNDKVTDMLYVGSIKTIIGHTEGTAGLASLIGTSQALQHGVIPPNMHFNTLSPRVAPFYTHLEVPTEAKPWPNPAPGQPRRASINSFGFGGTNAHAILEAYEGQPAEQAAVPAFTPLVISAASKTSLRTMLLELYEFLNTNPGINLRDLAYTLHTRRSTLPFRQIISEMNIQEVTSKIDSVLNEQDSGLNTRYFAVPSPKILGVFTGQGAQWPRMGARLVEASPFASSRLAELDSALFSVPEADRPQWSLKDQLLADPSVSRLSEAAISQPLCTAVQIVLVDMLKLAGIRLHAVVGHSSGEIAAAYAAGFLSATDAIRIAYYRGLYAKLAQSPNGAKGAMMAVGTSYEDALKFCELEDFEGRLKVAARNSSASITLSGDKDAIAEAVEVFKDEGKFARQLKVDTAYHSHHMRPCAAPYLEAMKRCNVATGEGNSTTWYSSVSGGQVMAAETLGPQYWVDNMTQAVLFSPAVSAAVAEAGSFDLALEIGPHPALKGPALETIEEVAGNRVPYSGVLSRGKNDIIELSSALGFTWMNLGAGSVNFDAFEKTVSNVQEPKSLVTGLPKYPFDHSRSYMMLTRFSGGHANIHSPPHPLLGRRCFERETTQEVQWRNFLGPKEVGWLNGHKLQGQTVFPATGYIAMAVEAMAVLAGDKPIGLINLENFVIARAITFNEGEIGVETSVILKIIRSSDDELCAEFTCCTGLPFDNSSTMALNSKATITLSFHEPGPDTLSSVRAEDLSLVDVDVDVDRFYTQLTRLGYNYSGSFRAVKSIRRQRDFATGIIEDESEDNWEDQLIVHPCWLDTAIQTGFAAYCYPQDERLWTLHVPTASPTIVINPYFTRLGAGEQRTLHYQSAVRDSRKARMSCDIEVLAGEDGSHTFVQVESLELRPFSPATADSDAVLFSHFDYKLAGPSGEAAVGDEEVLPAEKAGVVLGTERMGFFYLRRLIEQITPEEKANTLPHYQRLLDWAEYAVKVVSSGKHPNVPQEAVNDTHESIKAIIRKYYSHTDVRLVEAVGENIVDEVRKKGSILEHMMKDGVLDMFYEDAVGLDTANIWIGRMVAQIAHRYPHMRILEIGAGTGGSTRSILPELGSAFSSYTYTDISAGFFDRAQERFKDYSERMIFKTFDMERPPVEQGYTEGYYDIVLASNVLHATGKLDEMMANVRQLIKPGGYLINLEIITNEFLGIGTAMGGLPGWWAGAVQDERRRAGPTLTLSQWDKLTRDHGFSGIETATPPAHKLHPYSVFAAQAVDDRLSALRSPLSLSPPSFTPNLVIVGGSTAESHELADRVCSVLGQRYSRITRLSSLEELSEKTLDLSSSVLSLTELDEPFLQARSASKLQALRTLWRRGGSILWATRGCRDDNPYSSMMLGLSRAMRFEYPNINLQMLDLDSITTQTSQILAETLIRLELLGKWHKDTNVAGKDFLWSLEPELVYENNRLLIPRMYPHKAGNDRYNTYRRAVHQVVNPKHQIVSLEPKGQSYELSSVSPLRLPPFGSFPEGRKTIRVSHSILQMIKVHNAGYFMLCAGTDTTTGQHLIALSDTAETPAPTLAQWAIPVAFTPSAEALVSVAAYIIAKSIIAVVPKAGSILIHEVDAVLGDAITKVASQAGIMVLFSSSIKGNSMKNCVYVHRNLPTRLIRRLLPRNISFFVNLAQAPGADEVGKIIAKCLPSHTPTASPSDFISTETLVFPSASTEDIHQTITEAWQLAQEMGYGSSYETSTVGLQNISSHSIAGEPLSIVDWSVPSVKISLQPIDTGNIFRADGTYLLVGLTGQLGQSLCHWMVTHGARNVVLTSRNPKIRPAFIKLVEEMGATVKFMPLDVTSRDSLHSCYQEICRTMPPVIGVANGAMILEDQLFDNLTWESFNRQLAPKVDGSKLLDELFYTAKLDFFILFTSLGNIIGNTGQASYVAANQYMVALAAQRKKRGVAGSAIAISSLLGIGYVERSEIFDSDHFTKIGYRNMSEQDYLQLFAEGIIVGKPNNPENSEIATGMSPTYDDHSIQAQFRSDPKFVHFIMEKPDTQVLTGNTATIPARVRLADVKTIEEAAAVIKEAFIARLKRILQIPQDETINERVTLVEQGVDSIMAVEVRTWFLKELDIDMTVLKILSASATIQELVDESMGKLPPSIVDLSKLESGGPVPVVQAPPAGITSPQTGASSVSKFGSSDNTSLATASTSATASVDLNSETPEVVDEAPNESPTEHSWRDAIIKTSTEQTEQMSFGQSRFWFLNHYVKDTKAFNITCMFKLTGPLRVDVLETAVEELGQRHEALRTRYFWSDDESKTPMQGVLSNSLMRLEVQKVNSEAEVAKEYDAMRNHEWDLSDWITVRIRLLSLPNSVHYLLVGTHHISLDGHSFNVMFLDLNALYSNRPLPALPSVSQYRAFATHQRRLHESGKMTKALDYYRGIIPQDLKPISLFSFAKAQARPALDDYSTHEARFQIQPILASKLKQLARKHRSTSFHLYLAALQALVFRMLPETNEFFIGIADANRLDKDFMGSIGLFLNLLPLRFDRAQSGTKFSDTIQAARNKAYTALEHSSVPFDVLLNDLNIPRSSSSAPIFQILVDYRLVVQERTTYAGCRLSDEQWHAARIGYDIGLEITENPSGESNLTLRMQDALYTRESTELFLRSFVNLLEEVAKGVDLEVDSLPKWSKVDIEKILVVGRGTDMDLTWPATISHRVDEVIQQHADSIALKDGYGHVLSYQAMGERIESIAHALRAAKTPQGAAVGVFQAPSADWICSLLAILRVGAVYVPLDVRNSIPRLKSIMSASRPAAILTDKYMAPQIREIAKQDVLSINVSQLATSTNGVEPNAAKPGSPAIILFTSGSTGEPKGIVMSHASLCAHFEGFHRAFDIASMAQVVLQQSTYSFDYSLNQIFAALAGGGCLYVAPAETRGDPHELAKAIIEHGVTYTAATPSEYDMWFRFATDDLRLSTTWKAAWFGGEATSRSVINGFRDLGLPGLRTFSGYGPAEMTVSSTKAEVLYQDENLQFPLPGGLMLPNYSAYIVDENLDLVPVGVPGEIVLGGVGVATGYLGQADLTKQKFLPNPFAKKHPHYVANKWDRIYRSGDRGRLREDGAIYCDGRIDGDTQVKLRGFRIELGEIENVIVKEAAGAIVHAVVTLRDGFLVAHVAFTSETPEVSREVVLNELRSHLPLPPYMCPSLFVALEEIPLTSHLKIDRRAIQAMPIPDAVQVSADAQRDLTQTEEALAELWLKVIPHRPTGLTPQSDFFHAGGNSLLLVKLQTVVKNAFGAAPRLIDLMNNSALEDMASLVGGGADTGAINWDAEVALEESIHKTAQNASTSSPHRSDKLRVLMTGATGNLGRYILPRLVQDDRIGQVICIVRGSSQLNNALFSSSSKISVIESDLALPNLGLSETEFTRIGQNIDVILHCAANRNFWDAYEILRPVNVGSIKALARLALLNHSKLHFLSSGTVAVYGENSKDKQPPADGSDGYVASKWAAERYLSKAAQELGLSVTVHRPEAIKTSPPDGNDSVAAVAQDLINFAKTIGIRPDFGRVEGTVDMAPVDDVASRIVADLCGTKKEDGSDPSNITVVHHAGEIRATTGDLALYASQMEDAAEFEALPTMPVLKWFGEAKRAGFRQFVTAQELVVSEGGLRLVSRR